MTENSQSVLLHACCGPCTAGTVPQLREEGIRPVLYWNNPNIHPFTEYSARLNALRELAAAEYLPLVIDGSYGVRAFTAAAASDPDSRCSTCYAMRMDAAAEHAARNGFSSFTTTLLVSPWQNRDGIIAAGEAAAARHGVAFLVRDFRPGFRSGQQRARDMGLYMQKYCGCIYSEEDRYEKKARKIPLGFHPNFPQNAREK